MHDAACLEGVLLIDFDEGAVVEAAKHGEVVVDDVVDECAEGWEEEAFGGFAEVVIFLRGEANDCGGVDGVVAVCDGCGFEDGVTIG